MVITAGTFDLLVEVVCEDDDHLLDVDQQADPGHPRRALHRDLRLPQAPQADLQLGNPMTTTPHDVDRPPRDGTLAADAARDHLWMHFTRHVDATRRRPRAGHRARRGRLHLGRPGQALPRRPGRAVRRPGRPRPHRAGRGRRQAGQRAGVLPAVVLRAPARRSSWPSGSPTYAPGDLNRVFFTTGGGEAVETRLEAGQAVLQADRQADQAQGDQPRRRLPRHAAGRAVDHRHPGRQGDVRAAGARRATRCRTPTSTAPRSTARRPRGVRPLGRRPDRARRSSSRAPTPSPRSSSSRCRTPAAASRRRPATSSGSARSATSTTCCSSPTR